MKRLNLNVDVQQEEFNSSNYGSQSLNGEQLGKMRPEISQDEYRQRRANILKKMPKASIAFLHSADQKFRNSGAEYPFRQDSDFYYLTGYKETESTLVFIKDNKEKTEIILFCKPNQPEEAVWTGLKPELEDIAAEMQIKVTLYSLLDANMSVLLDGKECVVCKDIDSCSQISLWWKTIPAKKRAGKEPSIIPELTNWIHEARLIKSKDEIELLKKAAEIAARAHCLVMKNCRPDKMEYELEAEFLFACYREGCRATAYSTIVGGGKNACVLHYTNNDQLLVDGELVLVDAGGEFDYYASDITRTIPVNGRFTADQKALYEVVLKAQKAAIEKVKPGIVWESLQEIILLEMVQGLVKLGILQGEVKTLIEQKAYKPFYMHSSGHWLGLDVHDVGDYKQEDKSVLLKAGMVFTVEPGVYIAPNTQQVDKRWWGMGIRIEDDILVTEQGCEILSIAAPKEINDIENLMKK